MYDRLRILLLACIHLLFFNSVAQIDSLRRFLYAQITEEQRYDAYIQLGRSYRGINSDSSIHFYVHAVEQAKALEDSFKVARSFIDLGVAYYRVNDLAKSSRNYFHGREFLTERKSNYALIAEVHNNLGWNFERQGEFGEALIQYQMALDFENRREVKDRLGSIYNNMGVLYKNMGDLDQALDNYFKSYEENKKNGDQRRILHNLNNIGTLYHLQGKYEEAKKFLIEALALNYQNENKDEIVNNLVNLSLVLRDEENVKMAEDSLLKALEMASSIGSLHGQRISAFNLYELNQLQQNYRSALSYYQVYRHVLDSIRRMTYDADLLAARENYRNLEIEKQNADLRQDSQLKALELQSARIWVGVALVVILLLVAFVVSQMRILRLKKNLSNDLERNVAERTKDLKEKNERLKAYAYINAHHLRGPVSRIQMLLYAMDQGIQNEEIDEINILRQSIDEIDEVIYNINDSLKNQKTS